MIRLEVEEYCNSCLEFEPHVERPASFSDGFGPYIPIGDTVVKCENRDRCERIKRHLEDVL